MAALWPATNAIIGVYEQPPPDVAGLEAVYVPRELYERDLFTREAFKAARAATRLNDWLHGLL